MKGRHRPGPYHLQAAINAVHPDTPSTLAAAWDTAIKVTTNAAERHFLQGRWRSPCASHRSFDPGGERESSP